MTDQNVISGTAPTMHVVYNAATNRQTTDVADANGNIGSGNIYDIQNRLLQASGTTMRYAYDAANKRIWRGDGALVDELTMWGIGGQRMGAYKVSVTGNAMYFALQTTEVYFGGKRVSEGTHTGGYTGCGDCVALTSVVQDRLGSIGKYYPYGQERPSATANDTEKFTGYFRDSATGLDYADQRYHQPGVGRFMTPDPYGGSAKATDPGSWNRYAYVGGDPVNRTDPTGQFWVDQWDNICTGCLNLGFDPWGWGTGDSEECWVTDPVCHGVPTGYEPSNYRRVSAEARKRHENGILAALAAVIVAAGSEEQGGSPYPKYLQVEEDRAECVGASVWRTRVYRLHDSDGNLMRSGLISEHLFGTDTDEPITDRPNHGKYSDGVFEDQLSVSLFGQVHREYDQSFTVTGASVGLVGYASIPVFVREMNGTDYGILHIVRDQGYVDINGDRTTISCGK